ncbi:MAG: hypothetical protein ABI769_03670 [Pseudomonadota bacterium]
MKTLLFALALLLAAHESSAACAQKRNRDVSFVELAVPDGAPRPAGAADFGFITDETTVDQMVAKVGPPDASEGTRVSIFIYCFADGTELSVASRDRVAIDTVRYKGKQVFKRGKQKK